MPQNCAISAPPSDRLFLQVAGWHLYLGMQCLGLNPRY